MSQVTADVQDVGSFCHRAKAVYPGFALPDKVLAVGHIQEFKQGFRFIRLSNILKPCINSWCMCRAKI